MLRCCADRLVSRSSLVVYSCSIQSLWHLCSSQGSRKFLRLPIEVSAWVKVGFIVLLFWPSSIVPNVAEVKDEFRKEADFIASSLKMTCGVFILFGERVYVYEFSHLHGWFSSRIAS